MKTKIILSTWFAVSTFTCPLSITALAKTLQTDVPTGVVEGFYGEPWTNDQRMNVIRFLGLHGLNTYVYAPKDDPYQRLAWQILYPPDQLFEMKNLVAYANKNHVNFVYSISPGVSNFLSDSITFSSEQDRNRLRDKIDQMRTIGIHHFMLSFDDVLPGLKSVDQKIYKRDEVRAQADLANWLLRQERGVDSKFQMWFTPRTYWGLKDNANWRSLRKFLNSNIPVIWTGQSVSNGQITATQVKQVTVFLGRKPIIWDNYPVNDYGYLNGHKRHLYMGPLEGRDSELPKYVAGYLSNPMLQPSLSLLPIATMADYLHDPDEYQPLTAWNDALKSYPESFKVFSEYASCSSLHEDGYSPMKHLIAAFWADPIGNEANLRHEFEKIANLSTVFLSTIADREVMNEALPWVNHLSAVGKGGLDALQLMKHPSSDGEKTLSLEIVHLRNEKLSIGEDAMTFIEQVLEYVKKNTG